jgi:acyl carrier protein
MTTMEKLNALFCKVFDDSTIVITLTTTTNDVDGWDSLSHVSLIVSVEQFFAIKFSQKELLTMNNVGDLLNCIESKLAS